MATLLSCLGQWGSGLKPPLNAWPKRSIGLPGVSMLVMGRKAQIQQLSLQGSQLSVHPKRLEIRRLLALPQAGRLS